MAFASLRSRHAAQVVIRYMSIIPYGIHGISYYPVTVPSTADTLVNTTEIHVATAASTVVKTGQGDPRLDEYR